jgi:hypothetical protein
MRSVWYVYIYYMHRRTEALCELFHPVPVKEIPNQEKGRSEEKSKTGYMFI